MIRLLFLTVLLIFSRGISAGEAPLIKFKANKKQWPAEVQFMGEFSNGKVFLEKNAFVFEIFNAGQLSKAFKKSSRFEPQEETQQPIAGHVYRTVFVNAQTTSINGLDKCPEHYNYFLGNSSDTWSTGISAYKQLKYTDLYKGIDMNVYSESAHFKYDLVLAPHADPSQIRLEIKDAEKVTCRNNEIHIQTNAGTIIEKTPFAYQVIKNRKQVVACEYVLENGIISFHFPAGYNTAYELVIDPVIIACTFTGATSYCNGEGSDSDQEGNAYLVGSCMHQGFPATAGAFQTSLNALYDMTFHKFNTDGSNLLFATYLGGSATEQSFSVHINRNEALIMGYTQSADFPVKQNAYDTSYNGLEDIVLAKFDTSGSLLIGATYMGGAGQDGNPGAWMPLSIRNYEALMDSAGNVYAVSASSSPDFPTTAVAYAVTNKGNYDGIAFKLDPALAHLHWSTFLGGSQNDCLNALRLDGHGGIYSAGTTSSHDLPATPGVAGPVHAGNTNDAFVAHIDSTGSQLLACSYVGTNGSDYGYLLTLDKSNNVYLYSLLFSNGAFVTTPNAYNSPNGRNVIYRLPPDLSQYTLKARFGTPTFISPGSWMCAAAFEVDSCGNIYLAGDAGSGFPTTPNALKPATNNYDLYYCVFSKDAASLKYGSYFGGPHSEWATFGVCRMDKKGVMYYSFNGNRDTPVTGNAYAASTLAADPNNVNFDHGLLKVDLQTFLTATSYSSQLPNGCAPFQTSFTNQSPTSNVQWVFGDGSAPVYLQNTVNHVYENTGGYDLLLIATDTSTCNNVDTLVTHIQVYNAPLKNLPDTSYLCASGNVELNAGNPGDSYLWSIGASTQTIIVAQQGLYTVAVSNTGCTVSDSTVLVLSPANYALSFPNIITPNSDGLNDKLDLSHLLVNTYSIRIYDRWGRQVFSSEALSQAWDGTINGKIVDGTYFYTIRYTTDCVKSTQEAKGYLTVIK